jgi:L-seryl-tRNA(Ser) seleniumtransferase
LGLPAVVNADATLTRWGGSVLAPGVAEAMARAGESYVDLPELQARVGARIAGLTRNEAGYVCAGAHAGITLAVASCVTGDPAAAQSFPALTGLARTEVVVFAGQHNGHVYAARQLGVRVVEVPAGEQASRPDPAGEGAVRPGEWATEEELRRVLGARTACVLWFAGSRYADGVPGLARVVAVARRAGVPVLVDAAAQVPPVASLWRFTAEVGADAVIFSGGKGLRGPQSTGLVLGSRRIVDGCRVHGSPNHAVGRGMKVGKEETLGLLAAVEWTLGQDEAALLRGYEATVAYWLDGLAGVPGIVAERGYPSEAGQPHSRAVVRLAPGGRWTRDGLVAALLAGDPPVAVGSVDDDAIALNPQPLRPGEETVVLAALLARL